MLEKILVVDDCEGIRTVAKEALCSSYSIQTACNGEEAIAMMTEESSDLVILDINMPVTDGWETLEIMRDQDNGWPEVPVIMLSIHKEPEAAVRAWAVGAQYYLPKPFSLTVLRQLVDRALTKIVQ